MGNMNITILGALIIYGVLMLVISLYWMKKVKKTDDFLMAHRGLGFFVLSGTIMATGVGTGVTLGASGLAYKTGWGGSIYPVSFGVGYLIVAFSFTHMRRYRFMTLSEEIACYYGGNRIIYNFANVGLFLSKVCWLTVQIMGGGFILSTVTQWPLTLCTLFAGTLIAIMTIPGGLLSVVYTDVVQAFILTIGFLAVTLIAFSDAGGFAGLHEKVPTGYFSFLGVKTLGMKTILAILTALVISTIADTNTRHRIYSAVSEKAVKKSLILTGFYMIGFSIIVGLLGMIIFALNPNIEKQDQAVPWLIVNHIPTWMAAIMVVSISAAIFSSGDSDAAVSGTFFIRHIYPMAMGRNAKNPLLAVRLALVVVFVTSTTIALFAGSIVSYVVNFLSIVLSGLAVVILLGRFWKGASWQGAVTAIILGAVVSLIVMIEPRMKAFWEKPAVPAALAALIGHVIVSLLTRSEKIPFEQVAEQMSEERASLEA